MYQPKNEAERALLDALPYLTKLGYSPWGCYIQALHETGKFSHVIGKANYWGIKVGAKWTGEVIVKTTHEVIKGKNITVEAKFKGFPNALAALAYYDSLIQRLYPNAYQDRSDPIKFFAGLVNGQFQWATDPLYFTKLEQTYRTLIGNPELTEVLQGGA